MGSGHERIRRHAEALERYNKPSDLRPHLSALFLNRLLDVAEAGQALREASLPFITGDAHTEDQEARAALVDAYERFRYQWNVLMAQE